MSNLPPPQLPPPEPPRHEVRKPNRITGWIDRHKPWSLIVLVGAALAIVVVIAAVSSTGGSKSKPGGGDAFKYRWSGGVCSDDGYSGVFTNADSKAFNGKLWAVANRGGSPVARDEEAVFGLAPGKSETVEFVWSLSATSGVTCSIESVDWSY
jgi:hypothetical protein